MLLLDLFVSQNKLTELEAKDIESDVLLHDGMVVDEILATKKITNEEILQIRSVLYGLPIYSGDIATDLELSKFISPTQAKQLLAVPLAMKEGVLSVGVVDPDHGNALSSLQFLFGANHQTYKVYLISYDTFKKYAQIPAQQDSSAEIVSTAQSPSQSLPGSAPDALAFSSSTQDAATAAADAAEESNSGKIDLSAVSPDVGQDLSNISVPDMFSIILKRAIETNVSDIHIEHMGTSVRIRYRVDGQLQTIATIPQKIHPMLTARIKILCGMKLDEKRKPQDGRFSTKLDEHTIDYRVSTFPGYYGEKVVIRILDSYRGVKLLDDLGFSEIQMKSIRSALGKPYGIVLISGPTGSGKTTTLYSMLNEIDREHRNVVSLEDPIEYNVPSMNQSQVFPEIGYTFASGLRSILRQDPDVIMVGEIRDAETASLAIQAALTGHLVFSTIHTNTAVGVITRLIDMGIEPYLIAPTIIATIGQRLSRKIADGCGAPLEMTDGLKAMLKEQFKDLPEQYRAALPLDKPLFEAKPNEKFATGMKGRMPVFEVLEFTDEIEDAVLASKSEDDIWQLARVNGMLTMKENAIIKCIEGKIPFTEVNEL